MEVDGGVLTERLLSQLSHPVRMRPLSAGPRAKSLGQLPRLRPQDGHVLSRGRDGLTLAPGQQADSYHWVTMELGRRRGVLTGPGVGRGVEV